MADCRDLESLFASYVDGESAPTDCAAIEAHLRACPVCRDRVSCEREVREAIALRRDKLRACASSELRRRCDANRHPVPTSTGASAAAAPRMGRRAWVSVSMAATLVLALAGVFLYGLQGGSEALAAQLAIDHVKCFEFAPQPSVLPDARALGREWSTLRGWTIRIPKSEPIEGLELLGMRRCISTEGFTAHAMYRWHGQPLSVYVLNRVHPRIGQTPQIVERLGQEAIMWSKGGRTYAVVTHGRPSDIEQVARYVRTEAE
jgi:anti-sigma factor RsiW